MAVPLQSTSSISSSSKTSRSSMKLKSLIISRVFRLFRVISKASFIIFKVLRKRQYNLLSISSSLYPKRVSKKPKNSILFGSFRLHYNFCSTHVVPVSAPVRLPEELYLAHLQYNTTFDESMHWSESMNVHNDDDPCEFSSYINQLEDKVKEIKEEECEKEMMMVMNEIDKLADKFIANCHEKFMLEKVDSYRRSQDMLNIK
ncbi:unnamed protein product [Cochlearia groenlandica]